MQLIYKGNAPPENNSDDSEGYDTLGASDGACMVTTMITQWLVRFMCKKLMQLMTPEALILKRKYVNMYNMVILFYIVYFLFRNIPKFYLETYLRFQNHFSIRELIAGKIEMLDKWYANKMLHTFNIHCYAAVKIRLPQS